MRASHTRLVHPFAQQKEELTAATQYRLNKVGHEPGVYTEFWLPTWIFALAVGFGLFLLALVPIWPLLGTRSA